MSYNKKNVALILNEYAQKREQAEMESARRKEEVYRKIPHVRELDEAISQIGLRYFTAASQGPEGLEARFEALKAENLELRKIRGQLLEANGFPADYTRLRYECEECSDSGYQGLKMCQCLRKRLVQAGFKSSGLGKLLETQSFDSFRLDHYSRTANAKTGYSDRQVMEEILGRCREYAESFCEESGSLLFIGGTGLGKTHLSSAIARTVIEKGFDVVYESAPNILSVFEKERFMPQDEELISSKFFDCDLLIMDDLGAEYQNKNSISVIYNLINSRLVMKKPMIISTNLGYKALEQQYDSRIISRLFGEFSVMLFEGRDLRRMNI